MVIFRLCRLVHLVESSDTKLHTIVVGLVYLCFLVYDFCLTVNQLDACMRELSEFHVTFYFTTMTPSASIY